MTIEHAQYEYKSKKGGGHIYTQQITTKTHRVYIIIDSRIDKYEKARSTIYDILGTIYNEYKKVIKHEK